jgi:transcriptional regulator with XRE-family HTH domain
MPVQHTQRSTSRPPKFPNRIREYRLKAGLSQRKLGEMLSRGRHAVSAWECGRTLPSVLNLMRMAKILSTLAESLYSSFYMPRSEGEDRNQPAA